MKIWPGSPYPLGATYDGGGTNFAIFSEVAERVELCLFDDDGKETVTDTESVQGEVRKEQIEFDGPQGRDRA